MEPALALGVAWHCRSSCNHNDYSDGVRGTGDDRAGRRLTPSGQVTPPHHRPRRGCGCIADGSCCRRLGGDSHRRRRGSRGRLVGSRETPYGYAGLGGLRLRLLRPEVATVGFPPTSQAGTRCRGGCGPRPAGSACSPCSLLMVNNNATSTQSRLPWVGPWRSALWRRGTRRLLPHASRCLYCWGRSPWCGRARPGFGQPRRRRGGHISPLPGPGHRAGGAAPALPATGAQATAAMLRRSGLLAATSCVAPGPAGQPTASSSPPPPSSVPCEPGFWKR